MKYKLEKQKERSTEGISTHKNQEIIADDRSGIVANSRTSIK